MKYVDLAVIGCIILDCYRHDSLDNGELARCIAEHYEAYTDSGMDLENYLWQIGLDVDGMKRHHGLDRIEETFTREEDDD